MTIYGHFLYYTVFSSYHTPNYFQYYQFTVNENSNSDYFTSAFGMFCLNDVLKQLQEILLFSYFLSLYKFLVHFGMLLVSLSTPNTLFKINTKSKTSLHLLIAFYRTINHANFSVGFFILELDILL